MRHPLLLVWDNEGSFASLLRPVAREKRWALQLPGRLETCLTYLRQAAPALLVLRASDPPGRELQILDRVQQRFPETTVVVVVDSSMPNLAGVFWDLGASL